MNINHLRKFPSFESNKLASFIFYFRLFSGVDFEQTNEYFEELCLCLKQSQVILKQFRIPFKIPILHKLQLPRPS